MEKCTENCRTDDEVDEWFSKNYLNIIYKNSYLDVNDPQETMKTYIEDSQYEVLSSQFSKRKQFHIEKGSISKSFLIKDWSESLFKMGSVENQFLPANIKDYYFKATL